MKILHVIEKIEKAAGTTTFCVRVAEELASLGHEVAILICRENPKCDATPRSGVRVIKYTVGDPLPFEPDLVHLHGIWPPWQHHVQRFMEKKGYPVVLSPHGMLSPWAMAHKRWKKLIPWYLYQRRDIKQVKLIFATSSVESKWIRNLGFDVPVMEVPLGTDLPERTVPADRVLGGTLKVLFVGRIYPVKGLMNLVRAAAGLRDLPIALRIVGPDQAGHQAELMSEASRLGVASMFEWPGPKYGDQLSAEYDACDILVLPSFTENFGATVVAALAHGKPVLASRHTPWEILEERGCGWWVNNDPKSIETALRSILAIGNDKIRTMGEEGSALVKDKFLWSAVVVRLLECYRQFM